MSTPQTKEQAKLWKMKDSVYSVIWEAVMHGRMHHADDIDYPVDLKTFEVMQLFTQELEKQKLEAQLQSIDKVFELSPKGSFQNWKPIDAFHFYERLKAYEREILAQLNQPNTNKDIE